MDCQAVDKNKALSGIKRDRASSVTEIESYKV